MDAELPDDHGSEDLGKNIEALEQEIAEEEAELAVKAVALHLDDGELKGRIDSDDYPSRFRA